MIAIHNNKILLLKIYFKNVNFRIKKYNNIIFKSKQFVIYLVYLLFFILAFLWLDFGHLI